MDLERNQPRVAPPVQNAPCSAYRQQLHGSSAMTTRALGQQGYCGHRQHQRVLAIPEDVRGGTKGTEGLTRSLPTSSATVMASGRSLGATTSRSCLEVKRWAGHQWAGIGWVRG